MKRVAFAFLVLMFLYTGCSAAASTPAPAFVAPSAVQSAPMEANKAEMASGGVSSNDSASGQASPVDQLVIQNATISIVVSDPAVAMEAVTKLTEDVKGYIVDSNIYKTSNENGLELPQAHLTIRVPSETLTSTLDKIKSLVQDPSIDVLSENRSGQNVTKEYTDQKSRLKNLEDAEAQLREIMASATRTEDVMAVFNQLTQIREQIEVTKGQIKYYEESAAMSAVDITIQSKAAVAPLTIGSWQPAGVAKQAIQALINALKFFAEAGIWIVLYIIPVIIILLIPIFIIIWIIRMISRRNKAKKLAAEQSTPLSEDKKKE
jgi:TolA-binding protein